MRLLLLGVFAAALAAADWKTKPFPEWTDETVMRVLTDSPWAHPRTVAFTWREREQRPITYKDIPGADHGVKTGALGPLGGIGAPVSSLKDKADIIVRWCGALPVRHATALYKHREAKGAGSINERIANGEQDYVVELFGLPAELAHQSAAVLESVIREKAFLRVKNGTAIKSSKVEVTIFGLTLSAKIHFPRTYIITAKDGEVELIMDAKVFAVTEKFKLAPMNYLGHLEL
jgi:hypothetical protein